MDEPGQESIDPEHQKPENGGSKYNVQIGFAQGVAIGDGATLVQHVHPPPPPLTSEETTQLRAAYRARVLEQTRFVTLSGIPLPRGRDGRPMPLNVPLDQVYIHLQAIEEKARRAQEETERRRLTGQLEPREEHSSMSPHTERRTLFDRLLGRREERRPAARDTLSVLRHLGEYLYRRGEVYQAEERPAPVDPFKALAEHKRLVILGAPGAGKSTLLRYLARRNAQEEAENLPVLVSLRDYATARGNNSTLTLRDFTLDRAADGDEKMRQMLTEAAAASQVLWLVDALDEARGWAEDASRQTSQLPGQVVLTSRPVGYVGTGLGTWPHFEVLPLVPEDADQFLQDWFNLLAGARGEGATWGQVRAAGLKEQLVARPQLEPLLRNPLLLTFLVILAGAEADPQLPAQRAELYRCYIEELLDSWEAHRRPQSGTAGEPALVIGPLTGSAARQTALECFYYLGWALHLAYYGGRPKTPPTRPALEQTVAGYLRAEYGAGASAIAHDGIGFWEEAGLLETWNLGEEAYLAFRHLTFQEYAAAWGLAEAWQRDRKRAWTFLRPRLHHYAWREPVLLLVGVMEKEHLDDLAGRLLRGTSRYERELHRGLRLAAELLAEGADLTGAGRIVRRLERLATWGERFQRVCLVLASLAGYLVGLFALSRTLAFWPWYWVVLAFVGYHNLFWYILQPWRVWPFSFLADPAVALDLLGQLGSVGIPALARLSRSWLAGEGGRTAAAERLGQLKDPQAIPMLVRALSDDSAGVRRAAIVALGQISDPLTVPSLISALLDGDKDVRQAAAVALGRIGDPGAVGPLVQAFRDGDPWTRPVAALALGQIGDAQAVSPLLQCLQDTNPYVREASAWALGQISDPRAGPALIQALRDDSAEVCWAAVWGLGQIETFKSRHLEIQPPRDSNGSILGAAAWTLEQSSARQTVPSRIRALQDGEWWMDRAAASWSMGLLSDPRVVPPLIRALQDSNPDVRRAAAAALARIRDSQVGPALGQALQDSEAEVRVAAAWALGQTRDSRTISSLIPALRDSNGEVREAAVRALGQFGDAQTVPLLTKALRDSDANIRRAAASALGHIKAPHSLSPLARALRDGDERVREAAAKSLGQTNDSLAIPLLVPALRDGDERVREAAIRALGQFGDPQAIPLLVESLQDDIWHVRRAAADALGHIKTPQSLSPLVQALRDSDLWVRMTAAESLGRLGIPQSVPTLLEALQDNEEYVRRAAADALGQIKDPRAVLPLLQMLQQENGGSARMAAIEAIEQTWDVQALSPLLLGLQHGGGMVRWSASVALGLLGDERAVHPLIVRLRQIPAIGDASTAILFALGNIASSAMDLTLVRRTARTCRRRLTSLFDREQAFHSLDRIADRLAVLEVAAQEAEDPLVPHHR